MYKYNFDGNTKIKVKMTLTNDISSFSLFHIVFHKLCLEVNDQVCGNMINSSVYVNYTHQHFIIIRY